MNLARWIASTAAVGLLAGCAGYSPSVAKDERPGPNDAYLYGRFHIDAPRTGLFAQTMGFVFKCEDQRTYTLRFEKDDPLQVVKIAPSSCTMAEIVYSDSNGTIRKPAPGGGQKFAPFVAGKAYYLGDFYAESTSSRQGNMITHEWHMKRVVNDYAGTTATLQIAYPNLGSVPTENRLR